MRRLSGLLVGTVFALSMLGYSLVTAQDKNASETSKPGSENKDGGLAKGTNGSPAAWPSVFGKGLCPPTNKQDEKITMRNVPVLFVDEKGDVPSVSF